MKTKKPTKTPPVTDAAKSSPARPGWVVNTIADVARFFRVRQDTVAKEWIGMPGNRREGYDLSAILEWKNQRMRDPERISPGNATEALARRRQAEAELAEEKVIAMRRDNDLAAGKLVDSAEVTMGVAEGFCMVKAFIEDIPDVIAREVSGEQREVVKELAENIVYRSLVLLSQQQIIGGTWNDAVLNEAVRIQNERDGVYDSGKIESVGAGAGGQSADGDSRDDARGDAKPGSDSGSGQ